MVYYYLLSHCAKRLHVYTIAKTHHIFPQTKRNNQHTVNKYHMYITAQRAPSTKPITPSPSPAAPPPVRQPPPWPPRRSRWCGRRRAPDPADRASARPPLARRPPPGCACAWLLRPDAAPCSRRTRRPRSDRWSPSARCPACDPRRWRQTFWSVRWCRQPCRPVARSTALLDVVGRCGRFGSLFLEWFGAAVEQELPRFVSEIGREVGELSDANACWVFLVCVCVLFVMVYITSNWSAAITHAREMLSK